MLRVTRQCAICNTSISARAARSQLHLQNETTSCAPQLPGTSVATRAQPRIARRSPAGCKCLHCPKGNASRLQPMPQNLHSAHNTITTTGIACTLTAAGAIGWCHAAPSLAPLRAAHLLPDTITTPGTHAPRPAQHARHAPTNQPLTSRH
jgi:hypothetical protein